VDRPPDAAGSKILALAVWVFQEMTTALLIIDLQQNILAGAAIPPRQAELERALSSVAAKLGALKQLAETAKVPVILVQHDGDLGHRLEVGTHGWQLRDEIALTPGNILINKRSCDAFHETELCAQLTAHDITHLVIGGCMTQYCVDTTTRRAVSIGYNVTLISDGHATADFGALTAEQIVAHHNQLLDGFNAGSTIETAHRVKLMHATAIQF
jgi:nicotinamidase-related amidase